jgi:hypothetical protein
VSGKIPNLDETSTSNYQKKNRVIGILSNAVQASFTRCIVKCRIPSDSCQNKKIRIRARGDEECGFFWLSLKTKVNGLSVV